MSIAQRIYRFLTHAEKRERIALLTAQIAEQDARLASLEAEIEDEARALAELRSRMP